MTIKNTVLPASSTAPSSIEVGFKDGKVLRFVEGGAAKDGGAEGVWDLTKLGINEVVEEVERHSRVLRRREELDG